MALLMTSIVPFLILATALLLNPSSALMIEPPASKGNNATKWPFLVPLDRESVPVIRNNVTISHKTSYSGTITVGKPSQEFRVVFDTGSAHVVLPSSDCTNTTCMEHRRYNPKNSASALAINVDGSAVPEDELCDQVTIGYGTGTITGEFVKEQVCPGEGPDAQCFEVNMVMAVDMSEQPFRSFNFDGIFGLALDSLALSPEFSFFNSISASKGGAAPQFGVFLTTGEDGMRSEIALGGHNAERTLTPLQWAPVAMADLGYWQVKIKEVKVDGKILDMCKDGTCRAIVDTGTSHLGVPGSSLSNFMDQLSSDTDSSTKDCRKTEGPELEFVLEAEIKLSLRPEHYMRPLSLQTGVNVGSTSVPKLAGGESSATSTSVVPAGSQFLTSEPKDSRICAPRLMPVNLPEPLGPKLFILGEPVLHQYYTVYDWGEKRVGFGISASDSNKRAMGLPVDDSTISFMQVKLKITVRGKKKAPSLLALAAPAI